MELEINLPSELWDGVEFSPVMALKRGADRRLYHRAIIVEVLRLIDPQAPTKGNLQRLTKIRRKSFLPLLRHLIECGFVCRIGTGTKGDPFRYRLREAHRPK